MPAAALLLALACACAAAADEDDMPFEKREFEGALGPVITRSAEYPGAARDEVGVRPGVYLRWGRYSLSTTGAFVNRRRERVARGLAADLHRGENVRLNLALRIDPGRKASVSSALHGLPDVRTTLRGRLAANWRSPAGWVASLAWSPDMLGRGGGHLLDFDVGREYPLGGDATWSWRAGADWGSQRLMQSQFGVPAASPSGYPAYAPGSGWRDVSFALGWRREFSRRWVVFTSGSATRLLGPARGSPFVFEPTDIGVSFGVARRF